MPPQQAISLDALTQDAQPFPVVQPVPNTVPDVAGLNADLELTEPESEASALTKSIRELTEQTRGESAFRTSQEQQQDIAGLEKQQTELSSRLRALQNEALAIPLQLQQEATGRGITAGGLRPVETAALRNNAIQALSTASLLEASRGNLATAQTLVDRAVAARFDPIKEEINAKIANLQLLQQSPEYTVAEKNRATRQLLFIEDRKRGVERREQDQKDSRNLALTAQKFGAPMDVVQRIQNARTFEEAQVAAGEYLRDPAARLELESMRLNNLLAQERIATARKERQLLGEPTDTERKANEQALKEAKASIPVMQDKITAIDTLKEHFGLGERVGANAFTRGTKLPFIGDPNIFTLGGAGEDFAGGVHKLVGGLTLDSLIEAKSRGATFGALSDSELQILANAATSINDWEIKDGKGRPTGYWDIDQKSFEREMDTIKRLTAEAIQRKQGTLFDGDEEALLDAVFGEGLLNPAGYYN